MGMGFHSKNLNVRCMMSANGPPFTNPILPIAVSIQVLKIRLPLHEFAYDSSILIAFRCIGLFFTAISNNICAVRFSDEERARGDADGYVSTNTV